MGGKGNDVYVFNRGDGQDTIFGTNSFFGENFGTDRVEFGSGILKEDVLLIVAGSDLIVSLKGTDDQIMLEQFNSYYSRKYGYPVKTLNFTDGTSLDLGIDLVLSGTDANDLILGTVGSDTIFGSGGNDTMLGGLGNDVVMSGKGNDSAAGDQGNDELGKEGRGVTPLRVTMAMIR